MESSAVSQLVWLLPLLLLAVHQVAAQGACALQGTLVMSVAWDWKVCTSGWGGVHGDGSDAAMALPARRPCSPSAPSSCAPQSRPMPRT